MNASAYIFALTMVAGAAGAQSKIDQLCGQDHINQTSGFGDVMPNPDGYYVRSLQTQLSHGDPRIVEAVGDRPYLCTRSAATPDMDTTNAINLANQPEIKYLFVPVDGRTNLPAS